MSVKKLLGGIAVVAVLAGSVYVSKLVWFKPFSFDDFQTRVIVKEGLDSPQTMSSLRMLEPWGITGHNAELDDLSLAHDEVQRARTQENYEILMSYEDEGLDAEQRFNKKLMAYSLKEDLEHPEYDYYNYPLTQLYGWHNNFPAFMTGTHSIQDLDEAEYYVARLHAARTQFDQFMEQLKKREEIGIIPPTFILEKVEAQLKPFVKDDPKENAFYAGVKDKIEGLEDASDADKARILGEIEAAITDVINPIWGELQQYVATLKAKSNNDAGAWKFPDGERFYKTRLEHFTTTDMTAEEIHQLGLSEVARLQGQMLGIFAEMGYDTSIPFAELIEAYADEPRHYYPDTAEGREQILADYTAMIEEIDAGIADQFNMKPKAPVEVVRVPEFMEQGAPGGYYNQPAMDGSRPGQFYANLYDIKGTPKYGMRALTYHEAVPGHHYQIALQMEQEDLPMFRQFSHYGAYVEGWALYAERVGWELGFMKTNDDKIGALQSELFRAVRLVVDTGIHAKKWTREQAIDYMASNTGMAMSDVVTEIERYIVWPGQATGYKIGQLTMLRLRDKARDALGDKFDIKAFHDLVLKGGAVPLTILEEQVDAFIEANS
ncbi:DUF885 domain-containing protein [Kordiimonas lipolytica]|uniref:DUF885 domain-containing protein n=1 Tax=Kordiimonas lipolytica TaxID=1662421 RepID=A0ABV8UER8_9PROT|nr:DUF885 domain-containing protein [Kordiimonas lipolytica]